MGVVLFGVSLSLLLAFWALAYIALLLSLRLGKMRMETRVLLPILVLSLIPFIGLMRQTGASGFAQFIVGLAYLASGGIELWLLSWWEATRDRETDEEIAARFGAIAPKESEK